jgi:hypothetical protein
MTQTVFVEPLNERAIPTVNINERVLLVILRDIITIPDLRTDAIIDPKATREKKLCPVGLPLLVDVIDAGLKRDSRREKNDRSVSAQGGDKNLRGRRRKVLPYLHRNREIKSLVKR